MKNNILKVAHWNAGSSHLASSAKGEDKYQNIKTFLTKNNFDLLVIPEANIECDLNKTKLLIEGYNLVKLESKLARLCC